MRVLVIGDYKTGTGPANVTKEYLLRFPKGTKRLMFNSKLLRAVEIILKVPFSDVILFSGYSAQNVLGMKWARNFYKPTAYIMHGAIDHENAINECVNKKMSKTEYETMELCDLILTVSKKFSGWLKTVYPEFSHKIDVAENGVDLSLLKDSVKAGNQIERKPEQIFTIGGGMPRKKIKHICGAIKMLNDRAGFIKYKLVVVGAEGKDSGEINSYPFVENLGLVDSKKTIELFKESTLFVQNSCFETFGLAPMEALMCGCNVLISKEVGALELFNGLEESDVIKNFYDEVEIASKIDYVIRKGNARRVLLAFDKESASWEIRTKQLLRKLAWLVQEKKEKR